MLEMRPEVRHEESVAFLRAGDGRRLEEADDPKVRDLYDRFESMIANCGEYYAAPAKTRIAFMGRIRFAGVTRIADDGMACNFALARPLASKRFVKVEEIVPGWWVHRMWITDRQQLDAQVQRWIARSYRTMGTHGLKKANQ